VLTRGVTRCHFERSEWISHTVNHQGSKTPFFLSKPAPCSYLHGRLEQKIFTSLSGIGGQALGHALSDLGFRRSQTIAYRPMCPHCSACVSTRVLVDDFRPSRNQRRALLRNKDLIGTMVPNQATSEQYSLFRDYLDSRHFDGSMTDMSVLDYALMVEESVFDTMMIEYRYANRPVDETLAAVALSDRLPDGLSMVYSFFDAEQAERSFGTYMILDHVERARAQNLPYVYLGYFVEGSAKMHYKQRFLPQERFEEDGAAWVWRRHEV
jgi:leucyl-tRNA---protein transferase